MMGLLCTSCLVCPCDWWGTDAQPHGHLGSGVEVTPETASFRYPASFWEGLRGV